MIDTPFRARFARWARPIADGMVALGVTPNQITWAAFLLAIPAAWLVGIGAGWAGLALWLSSRLLDGLDGLVARSGNTASSFGGYLDMTLDMAAYAAMAVGFGVAHPEHSTLFYLVLMGYVLAGTTVLALSSILEREKAQLEGNDRTLQLTPGLAEAGETTIAYSLFTLFPAQIEWLAWGWIAILGATVVQRTMLARRLLDGGER
ncbi:MAG: CDP-alcohol phosphatidyltransferase family protein [Gemmatimonadales bacterium]|nr:CDP-alcohol phosphatidyltransferase family protein [Gemmatimonadales bacterium]MDZ4391302.1 CDP-alcohol phosphatidyltransferase family protein [Gemmatimonadales bacterium]